MITRTHWLRKLDQLWSTRRILWLSGVRRVGKTVLGRQIADAQYYNCDLPSIQRQMTDPEFFLQQQPAGTTLILDEVHRLPDPSLLLKIAADAFPGLRILATGSSTLEATRKFRDSLTGRKHSLTLPPILWRECLDAFGIIELDQRLLHGGLPEMTLAPHLDRIFFEEWIDSFYARDVASLFGVRNRNGFLALFRLLCLRSGGQLDIGDLAKEAAICRATAMSYLDALEIGNAILRLPPFHSGGHREIIRQPRVYAFDTGLIAHVRGWETIREKDRGILWENLVLDELRSDFPTASLHYWRDKSQREVDFVVKRPGGMIDAIEAKINPDAFDAEAMHIFRQLYPKGRNLLVCPLVKAPYLIHRKNLVISVCGTMHLHDSIEPKSQNEGNES
jgi:predicted AAA+ superfamily ATPase